MFSRSVSFIKQTISSNPIGLCIVAVVLVLVFGDWTQYSIRKHYRLKMADELSAGGEYWDVPMPNRANTRLFFAKRSENGVGLYIRDSTGKTLLLEEDSQKRLEVHAFRLLGWSPDEKHFAYVTHHDAVCMRDGDSGKLTAKILISGAVFSFTWLSSDTFAVFNARQNLLVFKQRRPGEWVRTDLFNQTLTAQSLNIGDLSPATPRGLIALSPEAVAWRQFGALWKFNFRDRLPKPQKIWDSKVNSVADFYVSKETGDILLNCTERGGKLVKISSYPTDEKNIDFFKIDVDAQYISKVSWINNQSGYAYLVSEGPNRRIIQPWAPERRNTLFIKKDAKADPIQVLGEVQEYTANGSHLYITGSLTNEPTGIWDYDMESQALHCLTKPFSLKYARLSTPKVYAITNTEGEAVQCRVWPPIGTYLRKKYPLIIGQSTYRWQAESQLAANSGYYFAIVERSSWGEGRGNGPQDILDLYASLSKNPNIDTNRVFLFGTSAETSYIAELLSEKPSLWKGVCLIAPGGMPEVSPNNSRLNGILAVSETNDMAGEIAYQERAARSGVPVRLVFREGPHTWTAIKTDREHARQTASFLLENN